MKFLRPKWFWFTLALLLLIAAEFFRIYFIMPFPGSQKQNSVDFAYFMHCYINVFRFSGVALIAYPFYWFLVKGKWYKKVLVVIAVAFYGAIFYMANFVMSADKMFVQPETKKLLPLAQNEVSNKNIVIGVEINGDARCYPIQIIGYHHQVQDTVGGVPIIATYCTVCRTGRAFSPVIDGKKETFRLVGMDHFNAMFEDATTGSWWRQENGEAITGKMKGKFLDEIPSEQMTLQAWSELHPNTLVLQPDKKFQGEYDALQNYDTGGVKNILEYTDTASWQFKSWVVGVTYQDLAKAYDWNDLKRLKVINDTIGNLSIVLILEEDKLSFHTFNRTIDDHVVVLVPSGEPNLLRDDTSKTSLWSYAGNSVDGIFKDEQLQLVQSHLEYWHSWKQFHPNTTVYKPL